MAQNNDWWKQGATAVDSAQPSGDWWKQGASPVGEDAPAEAGFIPTVKRTAGQMMTTAATSLEDVTGQNAVTKSLSDTGQGIIDRNPAGIKSLSDVVDKPWLTVKESLGQFAPQIAAASAGGAAGAALGSLAGPVGTAIGGAVGGLLPIFTQEYGGIRQDQIASGQEDKARALIAAIPATALERVGMGKALKVLKGVPIGAGSIAKEVGKGVLKEGATEGAQNVIEQVGAFKDPTTSENLGDTGLAAVMGGIGGGIMGGAGGAVDHLRNQNTEARGPVPEQAPGIPPESPPGTAPTQDEPFAPAEPTIEVGPDGVARTAADRNAGTPDIPNGDTTDVTPSPPEQRIAQLEEKLAFVQQQAQANGWDQRLIGARDEATAELDALRPAPEVSAEAPGIDQRPLSQQMGIDPNTGPLSSAAAMAVDSGAHAKAQQDQALQAAVDAAQKQRPSKNQEQPNVGPSNQPSAGLLPLGGPAGNDAGRGTGLAGAVPSNSGRGEAGASLPSAPGNGELGAAPTAGRGNSDAPLTPSNFSGTPSATMGATGPTAQQGPSFGTKDAFAAIRASKQAVQPQGVTSEPKTDQAQQSIAQPAQTGGAATAGPAATTTAGQSATAGGRGVQAAGVGAAPVIDPVTRQPATSWVLRDKSTGAVVMETSQKSVADKINTAKYEAVPIGQHLASLSSPQTAQGAPANVPQPAQSGTQASQTPSTQGAPTTSQDRNPNWRKNAIQAGRVARELGLEPKGKRLAQIVAEVDAKDAVQKQAVAPISKAQEATENVAISNNGQDEKARWLKSVADMNRMSGQFGAQIDGVANGRLSVVGNPNATKQGRALMAAVDEARRAGATNEEIAAAATGSANVAPAAAELSLDDQLKQVNDELASQGQVKNANTRAKADALTEREKAAKAKMFGALGKLAALASKNTRMNWTPEEEQALLPIVIELFDGAMELGAVTFQKAVAYVRDFIAQGIDQETADAIPFETLQGAYIAVAGRHKDKGVTAKKEVAGFESLDELQAVVEPEPTTIADADKKADTDTKDAQNANPDTTTDPGQPTVSAGPGIQEGKPRKVRGNAGGVRGSNAKPASGNAGRGSNENAGTDYVPGPQGLTRTGSWFETAKRNIDLIELAIKIDAEKRPATPQEQEQLSKYVGFGASAIRNDLFPIPHDYAKRQEPNRLIWPNLVRDAKWKPLAERIEALPREWQQSILQSSQYAHYTSEGIIRSVWSALDRMGFKGGNVFEPGMGIGSFAMLMPNDVRAQSRYTGIEFDGPTALIAGLLSPQQNMIHGDFIQRKFPKNFFDVNVGNPPFSQTKIYGDPEYAKKGFMLHDFFFAKGIDLVRPGGIQVFVTSKGTMDKQSDKARKYLSERADLLGAIRLPSTAFEGNAGTSVVTDVIFLKKRAPGEAPGGHAWANVATVQTPDGPVVVNEYFAANPHMVLGQQRISGNVDDEGRRINSNGMGGEKYTVVSYDKTPAELDAKFAAAVQKLPAGTYAPPAANEAKAKPKAVDFDPAVKREGVIYLGKDGALMRVDEGVGKPLAGLVNLSEKEQAWFKSYVGLRDKVQAARFDQLNDGPWEKSLAALNKAYDAFRKEHGPIKDFRVQVRKSTDEDGKIIGVESRIFKNRKLYREDYDNALITSLEEITEDGDIVKAAFLKGRTIGKPVERVVHSIGDALAVSLDEIGSLNLEDVGRRLGLSREEAIEALGDQVYLTPTGEWQLADEYLSGDVVAKLEEAEEAARLQPELRRNVQALKDVQPEKLGPSQISAKLGASWVPESHVNEFAAEIGAGAVTFDPRTETWQVDGGNLRSQRNAGAEYGTAARSPSEILEAVLNSRSIKVTQTVDKKTVTDEAATTAANEMAKKIKDKFKGWVWTDTDRSTELVERYNKQYNNIAPRRFDGSHLTLPGVSLRFKLHPHQLRAIWRMVQTGNTYLAHAVGAGKTIEMIAGGMEQKRLGLIKKPMYVVPNHMLEQFSNEFMELYPMANIMVADDENFSPERRKAFVAAATLNNPDAIVITHDAFQRIGVKEESVAPIRDEILADLEIELAETAKGNDTRVRRSQLEQQIEAVKQRFDRIIGAGAKDSTVKFEDMGVDFVFADEAHVFRKLDFHTAQQIKGIDPNGSKRALDMYVKTRILDGRKPGRSMVFASGTPVTNTMGELYTIMRFFAGDALDKAGISTFDAWARQFGEVVPALEPNAAGKYELIERFAKFDNVPELMSRVRQFMDVLTSDNLGALVKRPDIKGGKPNLNITAPNKALQEYMKGELARRIEISKAWKPSKDEPANPDPIVAIITDGRFAALDPRFFGGKLEEGETSLLMDMGKGVVQSYHATKNNVYQDKAGKDEPIKGSTQLVFYNLGFGEQSQKTRGFNSRAAFTKILTDGGIPRGEIYWFDDANTDAKKEAVFKDVRNGKVKVLIGSAKKMGTGVNVQKRLAVLHYQDPPWFPADVEQPHGRIIRQGNQNAEGAIEWYTTKGTYQSTMWQMVGRKQRFIDQAFTGDKNLRSMDDLGEASLFEQAAAVASGDPRAIQLAGLRQDVERFERLQASHASEQINVASSLRSAQWGVDSAKKRIATYTKAFAAIGERYFAFSEGKVGNATYTKPGEFGQAIKDAFNKTAADAVMAEKPVKDKPIAAIGDAITIYMDEGVSEGKGDGQFELSVSFGGMNLGMGVSSGMGADVDATGLARRIFNQINSVDQDLRKAKEDLVRNEVDMNKLRKKLGAPFEYQQEMAEKYAELKRLEAELKAEGQAPAASAKPAITTDDALTPQAEGETTNRAQTGAPEANESDVLFSRSKATAASRADSNARNVATQRLVDGLKAKWTRAPEIIVARNMQDRQVPQAVRDYDETLKSQGATGEARGFIYEGVVYLLSDQLKGPEQIAEVLFHEVLGHYGLRGVFGEGLTPILQQLGTMRRKDVVTKARSYGLYDKDKLGGISPKKASDAQIWAAMSAKDRTSAAEEVLAEMAQTQPTIGFVKRAIALIRNWLRANVPGFKSLLLTDSDIIQAYIIPARGFVTRSNETPKQSIERAMMAFSRVWHGSPHKFLQFDSSKIGTGEGAQAYGHGIYLAESQAVSKGYMQSNPLGMDVGQEAAKRGINLSAGARGELVRQARANADPKVAARRLQNANSSTRDIDTNSLSEVISEYQKSLDGNLYQVDLPDDQIAKMLDWDKPLSEQTEQVKQALMDAAESGKLKGGYITGAMGERKYQPALSWGKSGESLLRSLERLVGFGGNAEALLKDIGIPGIRYLDGGSRGNGAGTSNYVIFPGMEKILTIIDVNGEPVTGAEKAKVLGEQMDMAFSRGTNEAMTNKDVVGNTQGGRSADDNTKGTDENTGLPLNADGTVTVYHHTSAVGAEAIRKSGKLKAEAEPDVYVTTRRETDTGYGDTAVPIRVRPDQLSIDDEFPDGRKDFRLNVGKPGGSINVTVANESTAPDSGGAAFSRTATDQTQTEAFKRWFKDSKVVDADGKPLLVYHGGSDDIFAFKNKTPSRGGLGAAYFTDSKDTASHYAVLGGIHRVQGNKADLDTVVEDAIDNEDKVLDGRSPNVTPVYLKIENPIDVETVNDVVSVIGRGAIISAIENDSSLPEFLGFDFGDDIDFSGVTDKQLTSYINAEYTDGKVRELIEHDGDSLENATSQFRFLVVSGLLEDYAKAKGADGIFISDDPENGGNTWIAFSPEQVKSAIGNNGDFDPANPDIRFSRTSTAGVAARMGDAIKSVTVQSVKDKASYKKADWLGLGLQTLGRRQIVDIYGKDLPQLNAYNKLAAQMEADKNEVGAEADKLAQRWGKVKDEKALAELMHDATLAQIDPDKGYVDGDNKLQHSALSARFNRLSDEAKQVYRDARAAYEDHHSKVREAIKQRIMRSELMGERRADLLKRMDDEFFKKTKGVYFPLARFGQYVVAVKGPNGKIASVNRAETMAEAQALRASLVKAFPPSSGHEVVRPTLSKEFIASRDAVGRGFMTELYGALEGVDMGAAERMELEDTLGQLYLSSLPDLSWAKHGIHRKGTPGFSQDARRAFAQNMFHGGRYLAKLRYADLMQSEITDMQKMADDWKEVEDFDQPTAQRVVDEMQKRHESLMNPKSNPLSSALTSFGFVFFLGLSPASALVNLSQTALVAYPVMAAKWGFDKSAAALLRASKQAAMGKNDITGSLNAEERAAYDEAVRAGTIDVTMAHDLAGIAQGEDSGVMWKIRPVMRWASFMFHHAERFNRQVTFIAAYRLAKDAGADAKTAFEQATDATYKGHFDYSSGNRARIMQGNTAKVLLLFKQYGQNVIYTLARSAQQAIKGETPEARREARRALTGLLVMHGLGAGALGLPLVTTLLAAASMIGGDDDEPWDAKVALQNMLADAFGQKPAEVLMHGLSRLTPWDVSGRIGLDRLILPDVQEGLEGQRLAESAMTAALGPVAGIGVNVLKGIQDMSNGQFARGLEGMLPAAVRNGAKAVRYANEGAQDKSGIVIKDEVNPAEVIGQALGFSPSSVRNASEGKSAVLDFDRELTRRRGHLLTEFANARRDGDADAVKEAQADIAKFNEKNPGRRITVPQMMASVRARQMRIDQAKDGVYLPKNRTDARDAGRFAIEQ